MATWLVFGLRELARVEAPDREHAIILGERAHPGQVARVQSLVSYRIQQDEATAAVRERRREEEDG